MYCSNCGKEINESAKFCSNCGEQQNSTVIDGNKEAIPEKVEIENCDKCNQKKRNIYIGTKFLGKRVCLDCDVTPGRCPNCGSQLRTSKAQQCGNCKASWRELPPTQESNITKTASTKTASVNEIKCPKCKSTSITANKKGFGLGKAVVGGVLTGGVGLLSGFIGSNKIKLTCLSCGHTWEPRKK